MKFLKRLKQKWNYEIKYWHRDFVIGIKNLFVWFPVIWSDKQWDHYFIYAILQHKLKLMERYIRLHGVHINNLKDAHKIKMCVLLLERIKKDGYHQNVFKPHYKKWGEPDLVFTDSTEYPDCQIVDLKYPNIKTDEDDKRQEKEFKFCIDQEAKLRKQDLDLLFKMMRKHVESWWD